MYSEAIQKIISIVDVTIDELKKETESRVRLANCLSEAVGISPISALAEVSAFLITGPISVEEVMTEVRGSNEILHSDNCAVCNDTLSGIIKNCFNCGKPMHANCGSYVIGSKKLYCDNCVAL